MKPEPIFEAVESILERYPDEERRQVPVVLTSPQGNPSTSLSQMNYPKRRRWS